MDKRVGAVCIVIDKPELSAAKVNECISRFSHLVLGRIGLPARGDEAAVITLVVEGGADELGAFAGQLGALEGANVKSALTSRSRKNTH